LEPYQHKCRVVPFFVDLVDYPLCNGGSVRVHGVGYDRGKPMVLFVGRLVYYKGTEYLIRAMQHADATLTIIGDGPMRGRLESLSRELGLQRKISFLGHVPAETLHEYYRACRCLVLPSVEPTEAFGLVQLEAMAYGKPVVNTCLPTGVPFVSVHGETGFTVPPRDPGALAEAINRLCADEDLCVRLGRQARQRVEMMFSKDVVLNQIKSIYWELLRGRPKGV
jgi:rhamnosyl/mannosyltransferase